MKKLFLIFGLLVSMTTISVCQTSNPPIVKIYHNDTSITKSKLPLETIDSVYCDFSCMKVHPNSGKNTLICGLVFNVAGGIIMAHTNITYQKDMNQLYMNETDKEAAFNIYKAGMFVSIGFMVGGVVMDIIGINQMNKNIKCENGSLVYKF